MDLPHKTACPGINLERIRHLYLVNLGLQNSATSIRPVQFVSFCLCTLLCIFSVSYIVWISIFLAMLTLISLYTGTAFGHHALYRVTFVLFAKRDPYTQLLAISDIYYGMHYPPFFCSPFLMKTVQKCNEYLYMYSQSIMGEIINC